MKRLLSAVLVLLVLVGCTPLGRDVTDEWILPDGLKDCRIYRLKNSSGLHLTVVRCQNSSTSVTTRSGKKVTHAEVIEDVEQN